jgi:hypothetical protein
VDTVDTRRIREDVATLLVSPEEARENEMIDRIEQYGLGGVEPGEDRPDAEGTRPHRPDA